ncbi:MAG TPA: PP2C family protein-serine/threonine phosphatase, partial [bacterium]|nr:PP2C family protein-serine/threonine phosphatase [bacterium]
TVYPYSTRRLAVALYDVSGHGVSAALTASLIHNQIQFRLAEDRPPAQVIDRLNGFILQNITRASMFITLVLAIIDLDAGTLTASNAGHPDLLIWRGRTQALESIASHMPPIGMIPGILGARNETTLPLDHGDRILIYSDGFTDSRGPAGEMLGIQGMKEWAVRRHPLPPADLIDTLFADLAQFRTHEPEDDLTLVVVDIK